MTKTKELVERTYDWNGRTDIPMARPDLNDMEVAGAVRMLMRTDLDHEAICTLARDRIMALSKEKQALANTLESQSQELARLRGLLGRVHGCLNNAFAAGTEEREFGSARRQGKLMDKVEALKADVSAALSGEV